MVSQSVSRDNNNNNNNAAMTISNARKDVMKACAEIEAGSAELVSSVSPGSGLGLIIS